MRIIKSLAEIAPHSKIYIYGTGVAAKSVYVLLSKLRPDIRILGFLDTFHGGKCCRRRVIRWADYVRKRDKYKADWILIASMHCDQIAQQMEQSQITNYAAVRIPAPVLARIVSVRPKDLLRDFCIKLALRFLNLLFPKNQRKIIVAGEYGGRFTGNCKYLYLYLCRQPELETYWLVKDAPLYEYLLQNGIRVLRYRAFRTFFVILTAGYLLVDNRDWSSLYPILNLHSLKKIQLWHGVGFKKIEKMLIPPELYAKLKSWEKRIIQKRYPHYDYLASTSAHYSEKVFAPAFALPRQRILDTGYPVNDIFYRDIKGADVFTDLEIIAEAAEKKLAGQRIIVYAPTFRDMKASFDLPAALDFSALNDFLSQKQFLLIIKFHSLPGIQYPMTKNYSQIRLYRREADVYPLLKMADILITDYSSIYTDFLHAEKPILFFPFDYAQYIDVQRDIQFDYATMTPGPKAADLSQLLYWLEHFLIAGQDGFAPERQRILRLAFTHRDGRAAERIWQQVSDHSRSTPAAGKKGA